MRQTTETRIARKKAVNTQLATNLERKDRVIAKRSLIVILFAMNVYGCQLDCVWEDKNANFEKARQLIDKSRPQPGALIVLPETFSTGFSLNLETTCQGSFPEDEAFLAEIARHYQATVIGGVVSRTEGGHGCNQSVAISPQGAVLARYTKIQPFNLGGEGTVHEAGSKIVTFQWNGFTVAPLICYDLRFPEHFRAAVKQGANLFVVIASWPVKRYHHWLTLLQARAIENLAYVIGVNRTGSDPNFNYNGRSVVVSPHGHIIADAGELEGVVAASVQLGQVEQWRAEFPALKDMH
jgi:predicted amidohydrolase